MIASKMQKEAFEGGPSIFPGICFYQKKKGWATIISGAVSCPLRFGPVFFFFFSSAVLAPPVLPVSLKVKQTSGWAERQGSHAGAEEAEASLDYRAGMQMPSSCSFIPSPTPLTPNVLILSVAML